MNNEDLLDWIGMITWSKISTFCPNVYHPHSNDSTLDFESTGLWSHVSREIRLDKPKLQVLSYYLVLHPTRISSGLGL